MKLLLLFLVIASTLTESTGFALASGESDRTNAFEFGSTQRYLSVNSTIDQEDEERKLTQEEILAAFENFLPQLSHFSYDSIKNFAKEYFLMTELRVLLMKFPPDPDNFIISSLFTKDFLEELRGANRFRFEQHLDIALYLVLLEKVGGSTLEAAKQIDNAMKYKSKRDIALRMEDGQFHLWSHVVETEKRARTNIFESRKDREWRNRILERYQNFLANEEKRRIPGMIET